MRRLQFRLKFRLKFRLQFRLKFRLQFRLKFRLQFHPLAWWMLFGTFVSKAGFYMTMPYLAIHLHAKGIDPTIIGTILGTSFLVGTISSFFGGYLSDRVGRYPVMSLSMLLWSLVFVGFGVANSIGAFFALSAGNGLCRNVFEPASRAFLADVMPPEQQVAVFNARYFFINIGAALGPLIGVLLGSAETTIPFLLNSVVHAAYGVVLTVLMLRGRRHKREKAAVKRVSFRETVRIVFSDRMFLALLIGNVFVLTGYSQLETTVATYMGNDSFPNGVRLYAELLAANAIFVLLLQYPLTRFAKKFSAMASLKMGSLLFGAAMLGFGHFTSLWLMLVSVALFTMGEILCFVMADVVIQEIAPSDLRGAYFGANGFPFLGQSFGPFIGGLLLSEWGFSRGSMIFAVLAGLTVLVYPFYQYADKRIERAQSVKSTY